MVQPGERIDDKVTLVRPLGRGGMGTVWLARHEGLDADVAVKVVSTEGRDDDDLARLRREARLASRLSCPHVVRIFDVGEHAGEPYVVMERLEGESLAEWLERVERLDLTDTVTIVGQLAIALEAAHDAGIVHRDVKPANVFVARPGGDLFVKLFDFGVARGPEAEQGLTQTGAVVGTVHYMSPEQLASRQIDHRADLWALTVLAYRLLTGRLPFEGQSISEIAMAVERGTFAPTSSLVPSVGADLDAWFKRGLCRRQGLRFATARELSASLRAAARRPVATVERTPGLEADETVDAPLEALRGGERRPGPPIAQRWSRQARIFAYGISVALAMAAGLLAVASSDGSSEPIPGSATDHDEPPAPPRAAAPSRIVTAPVVASAVVTPPVVASTVATTASPRRPPPLRAPVAPKPIDCSQPFRVDEHGDYHPRPECLP